MNVMSPGFGRSIENAPAILTEEGAHVWRSKIVDKCAEAERNVLRLLRTAGGQTPAKAPLSRKLESLMKCLDQNPPPKRAVNIRRLLERLEPLSRTRAELAHSTMTVAEIEGEMVAVLRNAAEEDNTKAMRRILSLVDLKACHKKKLSDVANSLDQEAGRQEAGFPLSRE